MIMIKLRNVLRKIFIAVVAIFLITPCFAETGDIGDYGSWATPHNQQEVNQRILQELQTFGPTASPLDNNFVPLEAKIGLAFMGGLSKIGTILDNSLIRFAMMFMLVVYAFWLTMEAYNLIGSGADAKQVVHDIIIKGIWISVWLIVLKFGITKAFIIVMMPIIGIGNELANMIFNSIANIAGVSVANTCDAIKDYAVQNIVSVASNSDNLENLKTTASSAAGLLCIPSQMSSFFVTTTGIGWTWVVRGVGVSFFSVILGLYITYLSLKCIWKYLFISLGVIADIFLSIMLLPFTAIAETTAKTKYKGVAGDIFNSFLDIFKTEKLETQITRIITAALYFVCLAIAIGVSMSLLSFIVDPATGTISEQMHMDGLGGIVILILSLLLVCYMADKTKSLADKWAGKIEDGLGQKVQKDVTGLWNKSKARFNQLRSLAKKKLQ